MAHWHVWYVMMLVTVLLVTNSISSYNFISYIEMTTHIKADTEKKIEIGKNTEHIGCETKQCMRIGMLFVFLTCCYYCVFLLSTNQNVLFILFSIFSSFYFCSFYTAQHWRQGNVLCNAYKLLKLQVHDGSSRIALKLN